MLQDPLDYQLFAEISGQIVVRSRLQQDDLKANKSTVDKIIQFVDAIIETNV
jgi:hypothetical protein